MPASGLPPTLTDFLTAAEQTVRGTRDALADARRGSVYELASGPAAVLWSRQAARDRDLFRRIYFDSAAGDDLDTRVERWLGVTRTRDAAGVGTAVFVRPTAGGGAGTLYTGTRILVVNPASALPPVSYAVAQDTPVGAGALTVAAPVHATRTGTGVAVSAGPATVRLDDALFDATLACTSLVCAEGTDKELDADYLARAKATRKAQRVGYQAAVEAACKAAGATYVIALPAEVIGAGVDIGVNFLFVADAGYASPTSLLRACAIAVDAARVAGADLQILPMGITPVTLTVVATLYDDPSKFATPDITAAIVATLNDSFNNRPKVWTFSLDELRGAVQAVSDAIQSASVVATPGPVLNLSSVGYVLPRYLLAPGAIAVTFVGPSS